MPDWKDLDCKSAVAATLQSSLRFAPAGCRRSPKTLPPLLLFIEAQHQHIVARHFGGQDFSRCPVVVEMARNRWSVSRHARDP